MSANDNCDYRTLYKAKRKETQSAKQLYQRNEQISMENMDTDNQKEWREVGRSCIGNERKKDIPMEVKKQDGSISTDPKDVLHPWMTAFKNILSPKV